MNLQNISDKQLALAVKNNHQLILAEHTNLANNINYTQFPDLIKYIAQAKNIFLIASGRSGFAMRSAAMRLMHLGFHVYFVGETTTPAIGPGDLLWAASGSGTTSTIVRAAEKAKQAGANIISITASLSSPLANFSDHHFHVPAAEKQDHSGGISKQYAGSLFEQAVLLISDAVFQSLWAIDGTLAEELWKRHANME